MAKNIVICSDGTGNSAGKARGTNVLRLFNALDRHSEQMPQIAVYDDGVGTSNVKWLKLLGGAFGWGLSRNIRQLYTYLVQNYEPGDRVFLFGFSRGAFTVRSLAGMINRCRLLKREYLENSTEELESIGRGPWWWSGEEKIVNGILNLYRTDPEGKRLGPKILSALRREPRANKFKVDLDQRLADLGKTAHDEQVPIYIGVWDTVDAVGMPMDWLRNGMDPLWKFITRRHMYGFHDKKLPRAVKKAWQALAIDDERSTFQPNVWEKDDRVEQVWFAGAHSNVGGGYALDGNSYSALDWMMQKAEDVEDDNEKVGLAFRDDVRKKVRAEADPDGKLYDSRAGVAVYYRYQPRDIQKLDGDAPLVHESVLRRIERGTARYGPGLIPPDAILARTIPGKPSSTGLEFRGQPSPPVDPVRAASRWRTASYWWFLLFNLSVAGVVSWELRATDVPAVTNGFMSWMKKYLLPDAAGKIIDVAAAHATIATIAAVIFLGLFFLGRSLTGRMRRRGYEAWANVRNAAREDTRTPPDPPPAAKDALAEAAD